MFVGCGALMKKCVQCRSSIEKMVPFIVCCGGTRESHSDLLVENTSVFLY